MSTSLATYILSALAAVISLTVHEVCHGYTAYRLGDPTAKNAGRLSLNPLRHLDPFGVLCMILFRFGWAKPVPVNARYFKNPKRDFALTALAGPLSNLIMAFLSVPLFLLAYKALLGVESETVFTNYLYYLYLFLLLFCQINLGYALFNLLPIPPLDGSRLIGLVLPPKLYFGWMKYERTIYYIFLGWLLLGDVAARFLLNLPVLGATVTVQILAAVLDLSGLIGQAISAVFGWLLSLWELIPFFSL